MERNKKTSLLLLLLQVCIVECQDCPSHPHKDLPCFSDFNQNITCDWRSTLDRTDTVCTLYAEVSDKYYSASCDLNPVDVSRSALMRCSLIFKVDYIFHESDELNLNVSCGSEKHIVDISYKPSCHIKVNPGKPVVNYTTISWSVVQRDLNVWSYELQWKLRDEPWSDEKMLKHEDYDLSEYKQNSDDHSKNIFMEELDQDQLTRGENYEARVRVTARDFSRGPWSDWSPTVSWVSPVGRQKQPSEIAVSIWQMIVAGVAVVVLLLVIAFLRLDKTTWVYIGKRIRGPPIPNPDISFDQSWLHPYFTSDSFHSLLKPVEIVSVEVTSTIDAISPCKSETKTTRDRSTFESTCSTFSNPSYPGLCASPLPIFPLSTGNLEACSSDTPYGPVGSAEADQQSAEVTEEKKDLFKLLCQKNCGAMEVVSDYEKAKKLQFERLRLQSLDSGMGSGEEVSQESMEADSITSHDEDAEERREKDGGSRIKVDFQKLLGSGGAVFGNGSILVCSDYEAVEKLCCNSPGLPSRDCISGEEREGKPSESTPLLFPPCTILPQPSLAFTFSSSSSPCPLLMSAGRSVEPSGDGYKPLQQEQS